MISTVFDQLTLGSCVSNAVAQAMQMSSVIDGVGKGNVLSRLFLYYNGRVIEGDVPEDNGLTVRDGMKAAVTPGVCLEGVWPYYVANFAVEPPPAAYSSASGSQIKVYQAVPQDIVSMRTCLSQGRSIVVGFTVYDSFESDAVATSGNVPMPDISTEQILGGHSTVIIGDNSGPDQHFSDGKLWPANTFLGQNSWGEKWGLTALAGCFTIPHGYLLDPDLAADFWTIGYST
jgi:C1A family cysteine protease